MMLYNKKGIAYRQNPCKFLTYLPLWDFIEWYNIRINGNISAKANGRLNSASFEHTDVSIHDIRVHSPSYSRHILKVGKDVNYYKLAVYLRFCIVNSKCNCVIIKRCCYSLCFCIPVYVCTHLLK